jgi:large subunit ribosomal protein L29
VQNKKWTVIAVKSKAYLDELRNKTIDELNLDLVSAKKELFNLRFQNATNQLSNTARINEVRKNIARIQTVITERAKA